MNTPDPRAIEQLTAVLAALDEELDWPRLGASYCEGNARTFFDEARRAHMLDVGLQLVDAVAAGLPARGPRRSLYLGAALAELGPMLVERLVLAREVRWFNLPGPELDELTRALERVGNSLGLRLPRPDPTPLAEVAPQPCDHLWLVSVLSDPDAFPALHDELYERAGTPQATGRGDLTAERARAEALLDAALGWRAGECLLTTSTDELPLIEARCTAHGLRLEAHRELPTSALVGDTLCSVRLTAHRAQ